MDSRRVVIKLYDSKPEGAKEDSEDEGAWMPY